MISVTSVGTWKHSDLLEPEDAGKHPTRGPHRRRATARAAIGRIAWTVFPSRTIRLVCNASQTRSGCRLPALTAHRHPSPDVLRVVSVHRGWAGRSEAASRAIPAFHGPA